jgi:hypothetical protein
MKKHFQALALLLAASAAHADPVFNFNLTATNQAGAVSINPYTFTYFSAADERQNVSTVYWDDIWDFGSTRYVWHYADVSYQQQGSYRDSWYMNVSDASADTGIQYLYLTGTVSYDPMRINGVASVDAWADISGSYTMTPNPLFPSVVQLPAFPSVAAAQSIDPANLKTVRGWQYFDQDDGFSANASMTFAIDNSGESELGFLLYSPSGLNPQSYWVSLTGQAYDTGLHQFNETQYLGFEILAVPEPSTWAMLLAGAGGGGGVGPPPPPPPPRQ